ncbi:MAG: alpha/beta hydrolase [Myxococcales bacterium]|nr:alpha/beta hydrolase [Myxococcales bacterium]
MTAAPRLAVAALLIVIGLYAAVAAYVALNERSFIFPAPPRGRAPAHAERLVSLLSGQYFVYLPGDPVVVHFHGNGEDLADGGGMIDLYRSFGAGVLAVEYPGYGSSPGVASERSLYAGAEAALRWLRDEQHVENVVLSGQSLGSGVAVEMASRGYGSRMILISPFTSMASLGQRLFPWLPGALLVRDRFDTLAKAPRVRGPVLIVHGTRDELVPFSMGEQLVHAFPHSALRPIPGGQHNDLLWLHAPEMRAAIAPFLGSRP